MTNPNADDIIKGLGLEPHPEGGFFRETFRDQLPVVAPGKSPRAVSTAIYFLLKAGEVSRWHTVDAAEVWHHYDGAPLELSLAAPDGPIERVILGSNLSKGERPQGVVPKGHWQQARSLGKYTLVGCTVAPGFEFDGFKLAPPDFNPAEV